MENDISKEFGKVYANTRKQATKTDKEISDKAIQFMSKIFEKVKNRGMNPDRLVYSYMHGYRIGALKVTVELVEEGNLTVSDAAEILKLNESDINRILGATAETKEELIDEYASDACLSKDTERLFDAIHSLNVRIQKNEYIICRTSDIVRDGRLSIEDAAYICELTPEEYNMYYSIFAE